MVGRNDLPMATFRIDNWPIPEGANYSKEVQTKAKAEIDQLRQVAEKQALDRKIRQAQVDLPRLKAKLYNGDAKAQVQSKIARLQTILAELQLESWLAKRIRSDYLELNEAIETVRQSVDRLKVQTDVLGNK